MTMSQQQQQPRKAFSPLDANKTRSRVVAGGNADATTNIKKRKTVSWSTNRTVASTKTATAESYADDSEFEFLSKPNVDANALATIKKNPLLSHPDPWNSRSKTPRISNLGGGGGSISTTTATTAAAVAVAATRSTNDTTTMPANGAVHPTIPPMRKLVKSKPDVSTKDRFLNRQNQVEHPQQQQQPVIRPLPPPTQGQVKRRRRRKKIKDVNAGMPKLPRGAALEPIQEDPNGEDATSSPESAVTYNTSTNTEHRGASHPSFPIAKNEQSLDNRAVGPSAFAVDTVDVPAVPATLHEERALLESTMALQISKPSRYSDQQAFHKDEDAHDGSDMDESSDGDMLELTLSPPVLEPHKDDTTAALATALAASSSSQPLKGLVCALYETPLMSETAKSPLPQSHPRNDGTLDEPVETPTVLEQPSARKSPFPEVLKPAAIPARDKKALRNDRIGAYTAKLPGIGPDATTRHMRIKQENTHPATPAKVGHRNRPDDDDDGHRLAFAKHDSEPVCERRIQQLTPHVRKNNRSFLPRGDSDLETQPKLTAPLKFIKQEGRSKPPPQVPINKEVYEAMMAIPEQKFPIGLWLPSPALSSDGSALTLDTTLRIYQKQPVGNRKREKLEIADGGRNLQDEFMEIHNDEQLVNDRSKEHEHLDVVVHHTPKDRSPELATSNENDDMVHVRSTKPSRKAERPVDHNIEGHSDTDARATMPVRKVEQQVAENAAVHLNATARPNKPDLQVIEANAAADHLDTNTHLKMPVRPSVDNVNHLDARARLAENDHKTERPSDDDRNQLDAAAWPTKIAFKPERVSSAAMDVGNATPAALSTMRSIPQTKAEHENLGLSPFCHHSHRPSAREGEPESALSAKNLACDNARTTIASGKKKQQLPRGMQPVLWTTEHAGMKYKELGVNLAPLFRLNGQYFKHPPLPPGWTLGISRSKNVPFYHHPSFGFTYYCPVPLPCGDGSIVGASIYVPADTPTDIPILEFSARKTVVEVSKTPTHHMAGKQHIHSVSSIQLEVRSLQRSTPELVSRINSIFRGTTTGEPGSALRHTSEQSVHSNSTRHSTFSAVMESALQEPDSALRYTSEQSEQSKSTRHSTFSEIMESALQDHSPCSQEELVRLGHRRSRSDVSGQIVKAPWSTDSTARQDSTMPFSEDVGSASNQSAQTKEDSLSPKEPRDDSVVASDPASDASSIASAASTSRSKESDEGEEESASSGGWTGIPTEILVVNKPPDMTDAEKFTVDLDAARLDQSATSPAHASRDASASARQSACTSKRDMPLHESAYSGTQSIESDLMDESVLEPVPTSKTLDSHYPNQQDQTPLVDDTKDDSTSTLGLEATARGPFSTPNGTMEIGTVRQQKRQSTPFLSGKSFAELQTESAASLLQSGKGTSDSPKPSSPKDDFDFADIQNDDGSPFGESNFSPTIPTRVIVAHGSDEEMSHIQGTPAYPRKPGKISTRYKPTAVHRESLGPITLGDSQRHLELRTTHSFGNSSCNSSVNSRASHRALNPKLPICSLQHVPPMEDDESVIAEYLRKRKLKQKRKQPSKKARKVQSALVS